MLYSETIAKLGTETFSSKPDEESLPSRQYHWVFENIVRFAADRRHGGAFVVVPDTKEVVDQLKGLIELKYAINPPNPWPELVNALVGYRRYFDLWKPTGGVNIFQAEDTPAKNLKQLESYRLMMELARKRILEYEDFVASLSGVDGAVVLTTRCKVLGFGGEIVTAPSSLEEVKVAQNPAASEWEMKAIESYGTRHRSAFRLCNQLEDCVVFVVSQDGPIRAVKRNGADVFLWNDVLLQDYDL